MSYNDLDALIYFELCWACNDNEYIKPAMLMILTHCNNIFNLHQIVNGGWSISYEIALRRMPQDLTDDKSTLVQVMAWCR